MAWNAPAVLVAASLAVMAVPMVAAGPQEAFADESQEVRDLLAEVGEAIDGQTVYDCIERITRSGAGSWRLMATPTQDMFLEEYGTVWNDLGLKGGVFPFDIGKRPWDVTEGPAGHNIVGAYEGRDPTKWVVIGSHWDTQAATPGAGSHDNGSGMCTVWTIAKAIAELQPDLEASIVFGWWDGEEWGLFGSVAFVDDHSDVAAELFGLRPGQHVDIIQGIAVDMAGLVYPAHNPWGSGGPGFIVPGTPQVPAPIQHFHMRAPPVNVEENWYCPSYGCYEALKEREDFDRILVNFTNYRSVVEEVWRVFMEIPEEHVSFEEDRYGRSDHVPFTAAGIPGLRIQGAHDGEYPCYHEPCDTLEFMAAAAGGQDLLLAGLDMETTTTAVISTFMAWKGDIVPLGQPAAWQGGQTEAAPLDAPEPQSVPGAGFAWVIVAGLVATALAGNGRRP